MEIAANIKCPNCLLMHTAMATGYGASDKEIAEAAFIPGQHNYSTFVKEVHQISGHAEKTGKK